MSLFRIALFIGLAVGVDIHDPGMAQAEITPYVLLGPEGNRLARVITEAQSCPSITVDGKIAAMTLRAPAETVPQRTTASLPELAKPSVFASQTCEATISSTAIWAEIGGVSLPLPPKTINRIVVIGDTGCRIKAADKAAQACNDPIAYPFKQVATAAAAWKPDIVLHVGDYLYRENPCPETASGCANSPWGYGLDSWTADFFDPASALLRAAPWIAVRGNHESCNRAGQGWQRFLDAYPFTMPRNCDDPKNDMTGDFTWPFAVKLNKDSQIIVWDTSIAPGKHLGQNDPKLTAFTADAQEIARLALQAPHNILANHQPVLAFSAKLDKNGNPRLAPGTESLQDALTRANPALFPKTIDVSLSGHVHVWEQLSFAGHYPSQIVTGFSGTQEDIVPLPEKLPADAQPSPGAVVESFSSWVDGFGFMTLERQGAAKWLAEIHDKTGKVVNKCILGGRISHCDIEHVQAG